MKQLFAIKEEYQATVVGYNGSGLPLGKRSDLDKLAEMAYVNPALAKYFERLPTREELEAYKVGKIMAFAGEQEQGTDVVTEPQTETGAETEAGIETETETAVTPSPSDEKEAESKPQKPKRENRRGDK